MERTVMKVSQTIARRLAKQGAEAIVVFGSRVRGDAYEESDIDIHAIGKRFRDTYRLERHRQFLVSISWMTAKQHRQAFQNPSGVGGIIPAWRNAQIVFDPQGVASAIRNDAKRWRWVSLSRKSDEWVAQQITGWAEEVHRLVGSM